MKKLGTSMLSIALCVVLVSPAVGGDAPGPQQAKPAELAGASYGAPTAPARARTRFTVRIKARRYEANATIPVFWTAPSGHSTTDWVGVFAAGAPDTQYHAWSYVPAGTAGTLSLTAPATPGVYEVRYLRGDGDTSVAGSARFSVYAPRPEGYAICRKLVTGDPYHPAWNHCCDSKDRSQSYWRGNDGSGGWYSGSCYSWGVR